MSLFYTLAYRLGFAPWEAAATHGPARDHIHRLFDREEAGRRAPYGRVLDLGCGRGNWSVTLAKRGWEVTGVDLVPRALQAARRRSREAGVEARFLQGDITALRVAELGEDYRLIWDFGTVHGLAPAQQQAVGRGVSAVAGNDATILLLAWAPGKRGPLPRGMSREDLEGAFAGWKVTDVEPFDVSGLPPPLRKVDPRMYRLRRT